MPLFKRYLKDLKPRVFIIMGISALSLSFLIAGFLVIRDFVNDKKINTAEEQKMAYNLEKLDEAIADMAQSNLLFFENLEQLNLDMELYRSTEIPWPREKVREFWIPADRSDIDYFSKANHELIWDILKDAP